jgi:hypothetical protein
MPTSEEITPERAHVDSSSAPARERAPAKNHGPYSVILWVLPVMFVALFIAIGILGLLAKLFSW